jgi:hypothetical protein
MGIMIVDEDKPRRTSPDEGGYIIHRYLDAGGNYTRYLQ